MTFQKIEVVWFEDEAFNKNGFPLVVCSRCDGCGEYSYNERDGTRCFGCGGDGWQIAKRAKPAWIAYISEVKEQKETVVRKLQVGDKIVRKKVWCEVRSLTETDTEVGWTIVDGVRTTTDYQWIVEIFNGQEIISEELSGNLIVKRSGSAVDVNKYLAMVKPKRKQKETA